MHVEVEVQECALQLLIAASRRSDVDWTGRRHKHVLVRRRRRLRASGKNQQGRSHERQRHQDYESPHRSTFRQGAGTGFIYRTGRSCATALSCSLAGQSTREVEPVIRSWPRRRGALQSQAIRARTEKGEIQIAYVNVHTNDGVPPAGTGPGDLTGGEIRGNF
jgi:hypothetical protein